MALQLLTDGRQGASSERAPALANAIRPAAARAHRLRHRDLSPLTLPAFGMRFPSAALHPAGWTEPDALLPQDTRMALHGPGPAAGHVVSPLTPGAVIRFPCLALRLTPRTLSAASALCCVPPQAARTTTRPTDRASATRPDPVLPTLRQPLVAALPIAPLDDGFAVPVAAPERGDRLRPRAGLSAPAPVLLRHSGGKPVFAPAIAAPPLERRAAALANPEAPALPMRSAGISAEVTLATMESLFAADPLFQPAPASVLPAPAPVAMRAACPPAPLAALRQPALEFRPPDEFTAGLFVPAIRTLPLRPRIILDRQDTEEVTSADGTYGRGKTFRAVAMVR